MKSSLPHPYYRIHFVFAAGCPDIRPAGRGHLHGNPWGGDGNSGQQGRGPPLGYRHGNDADGAGDGVLAEARVGGGTRTGICWTEVGMVGNRRRSTCSKEGDDR